MPYQETSRHYREIWRQMNALKDGSYLEISCSNDCTYYVYRQEPETLRRRSELGNYLEFLAVCVEGPNPKPPESPYEGAESYAVQMDRISSRWDLYIRKVIGADKGAPVLVMKWELKSSSRLP
jgi:hypothetical protein